MFTGAPILNSSIAKVAVVLRVSLDFAVMTEKSHCYSGDDACEVVLLGYEGMAVLNLLYYYPVDAVVDMIGMDETVVAVEIAGETVVLLIEEIGNDVVVMIWCAMFVSIGHGTCESCLVLLCRQLT